MLTGARNGCGTIPGIQEISYDWRVSKQLLRAAVLHVRDFFIHKLLSQALDTCSFDSSLLRCHDAV